MPATLRTLMHSRAASIQYYKPHAMEEIYYWRIVTSKELQAHCVTIIGVFSPSDTNPFHPVLFNRRALNEGQLLSDQMIDRGVAAQTIYGNFLSEIFHLSHLYASSLIGDSQPSSLPRTHARNLWRSTRSAPTHSRRGPPPSPTERQAQKHLRRSDQRHQERHQERVLGQRSSRFPIGKPLRQHRRPARRRRPGPRHTVARRWLYRVSYQTSLAARQIRNPLYRRLFSPAQPS